MAAGFPRNLWRFVGGAMKTSNTVRDRFILQNDTNSVTSLWISPYYIFANYARLVEDKPLRGEQKSKRRRGFRKRETRWMQVRIRKLTAGFPWNWWSLVGGATKPHDRPQEPWIMNGPQVSSIVSRAGRTNVHSNDNLQSSSHRGNYTMPWDSLRKISGSRPWRMPSFSKPSIRPANYPDQAETVPLSVSRW